MNLNQLKEKLNKSVKPTKSPNGKKPVYAQRRYNHYAIELGQRVIEARVMRGMTQKALAKKIGTLQPSIARIERGASTPTTTMLLKIAKALGVELELPKFKLAGLSPAPSKPN